MSQPFPPAPMSPEWRKSSYSGSNTACVETAYIRASGNAVAIRDSKDIWGPNLTLPLATWRHFAFAAGSGQFPRP